MKAAVEAQNRKKALFELSFKAIFGEPWELLCGIIRAARVSLGKSRLMSSPEAQLGTGNTTNQLSPFKPNGSFQGNVSLVRIGGGASYEGVIVQSGGELWAAGYSGNANIGINSTAGTNNTFQRVLGQSGVIEDWDCFGQGTSAWGLGVLYDDGRVDACGENNSYGETGTQSSNLHDVKTLKNVIF